ncbi:MAG: C40 family peptidase [Chlorobium sp.]|nr:C40 family peptidase [Chlorobium sp.]
MSSCQMLRRGSGYEQEWKYSLKKRKSHISCRAEEGRPTVIRPLPMSVSGESFDRLFSSLDELLGTPYRAGGSAPDGFDCSGLVQYLYKQQFMMILPRTAEELAALGSVVPETMLRRGDLVFFSIEGQRIDHVGIFLGSNRFAHAANNGVRIDNLFDTYYRRRYAFSSRIITVD